MLRRMNSRCVQDAFDTASDEIRRYVVAVEQGEHGMERWSVDGVLPSFTDKERSLNKLDEIEDYKKRMDELDIYHCLKIINKQPIFDNPYNGYRIKLNAVDRQLASRLIKIRGKGWAHPPVDDISYEEAEGSITDLIMFVKPISEYLAHELELFLTNFRQSSKEVDYYKEQIPYSDNCSEISDLLYNKKYDPGTFICVKHECEIHSLETIKERADKGDPCSQNILG